MPEKILSAQNPRLKRLRRLYEDGAFRRELGLYPLEGTKLALEALEEPSCISEIYFSAKSKLAETLQGLELPLFEVPPALLSRFADTREDQGLILLLKRSKPEPKLKSVHLGLALEEIQDPGNLGTLLRSAWATAADGVFLSAGCADAYGPKAVRAAAGAQRHLMIEDFLELPKRLQEIRQSGVKLLALAPRASRNLWDLDLTQDLCFVLGSEGHGLGEELLSLADEVCYLETPGRAESLNAAVSGSLALFEALRQRRN
jgi:TrmH family RNA methyltransferase